MKKDEIINFIYYLADKVDDVYIKEVKKSVVNFVNRLNDVSDNKKLI